jgi:hypothetical protein
VPNEKFTQKDVEKAADRLSMLEYFPANPRATGAIMELLAEMCPHKCALEWLTDTMVNRIGRWIGPAELRGLLCWKFRPADGIEGTCTQAGFTVGDGESQSLEAHEQLKQGGWLEATDQEIKLLVNRVAAALPGAVTEPGGAR